MKEREIQAMEYFNSHNPVLPPELHVPDGEAHVMPDGRLYIYGSFDDRKDGYCSDRYHVISTPDLEHWRISRDAFKISDIPWAMDGKPVLYPGDIDWLHPTGFMSKMIEKIMNEYRQKGIEPSMFAQEKVFRYSSLLTA